ncbi:MAG: exonuclease domain-containing protein [Acholeplasmataceae bacterium]|jgi:sporulation inhibitor KapD|nr:exonuclease domain-containing protein [Acholeplasmataceae bacterium]
MRRIITDIHIGHQSFFILHQGRKIGIHLTNKLAKTFFSYLEKGVLVDFEITPKTKRIRHQIYYQVAYFNQIISLNPYRVHYDLKKLRKDMYDVLTHNEHYLFIDFEMTMPGYTDKFFVPEIIQVGYVLAKPKEDIICQDDFYVTPILRPTLSKRTKRFLGLDDQTFFSKSKPYEFFYQELKNIIDTYHPKLVVWGKNDITALNDSYKLHNYPRITEDYDFIDLLKLHKDYYNLKDDLGLFKAYKTYYNVENKQAHDAKDDALVTKYVFDAFLDYM